VESDEPQAEHDTGAEKREFFVGVQGLGWIHVRLELGEERPGDKAEVCSERPEARIKIPEGASDGVA
jgi:hypothetical protein